MLSLIKYKDPTNHVTQSSIHPRSVRWPVSCLSPQQWWTGSLFLQESKSRVCCLYRLLHEPMERTRKSLLVIIPILPQVAPPATTRRLPVKSVTLPVVKSVWMVSSPRWGGSGWQLEWHRGSPDEGSLLCPWRPLSRCTTCTWLPQV